MDLKTLDLQKTLSFEEVEHLLSMTDEFTIAKTDKDEVYKLTLSVVATVTYPDALMLNANSDAEPICTYHLLNKLLYKPTFQRLIRDIESLGYRKHCEIDSKLE